MRHGKKIDAIRTKIEDWYNEKFISELEYYILIACLIETVPFYANISGVYAAFHKKWDPRAKKELKGFGRLSLRANEKLNLEFEVRDSDLCFYDRKAGWVLEDCLYRFFIGFSSDDLPFSQAWRFDGVSWTKEA